MPPPTETTAITSSSDLRRSASYQSTSSTPPPHPPSPTSSTTPSTTASTTSTSSTTAKKPWYSPLLSLELENRGSVARDHLALERTFLAWLRTSLAFASIGIAITQLFRLNNSSSSNSDGPLHGPGGSKAEGTLKHVGKPLGVTFLGIAVVVLGIGVRRYFEGQRWLLEGKFPASRGGVIVLTMVAGMLIIASLVVIVTIAPGAYEN